MSSRAVSGDGLLALQRAVHSLNRALDGELADLGLTTAEANLVASFGGGAAMGIRDVIAATAQRASTVTSVVDRLERRGFVERQADPDDRRSLQIVLTPAGREAQGRVDAAYRVVAERISGAVGGSGSFDDVLAATDGVLPR